MLPIISRRLLVSALALGSILAPTAVHAQVSLTSKIYAFTTLNTPAFLGVNSGAEAFGVAGGVTVGFGYGSNLGDKLNALRWNADNTVTNLNTLANLGADSESRAFGVAGGVTVGMGRGSNTNVRYNALRWNANNTVTNLHAFTNLGTNSVSVANSIAGDVTVGFGYGSNTGFSLNALRWNANNTVTNLHGQIAASGVNLGANSESTAQAISGGIIVGQGYGSNTGFNGIALRWNANNTVTNLHTLANLGTNSTSVVYGVANGVAVGAGGGSNTGNLSHALRWNANNTVTDLHAFTNLGVNSDSIALAIGDGVTVGYGAGSNTNNQQRALRWNTDGSVVNLHQFVIGGATSSYAQAIDAPTGIIAGYTAINAASIKAVLWTPLNATPDGANLLEVAGNQIAAINQNFTQSAGSTTINGLLVMSDEDAGNGIESFLLAGGLLNGAGTLTGNLVNTGGIVAPGNSPGTLSLVGDYTQDGAGILNIEIASPSAFDVLAIDGTATLGGTLNLSFAPGFTSSTPSLTFDFLTTTGVISSFFDTVNVINLPSGATYQVQTLPNGSGAKLTLVVVPEAGTGLLALLAVPGLALLMRCRTR